VFLFDETAGLLDGLGRTVAVIKTDKIEHAAVHAAALVDHLEIGRLGPAKNAVGGRGAA